MTTIASVYATFGSDEEAQRIGRAMVEERRAACVNILGPCRSIYRLQGRIEQTDEVAAIFKTSAEQAPLLIERIAELHGYDNPAVVAWPVEDAAETYCAWVRANTL